MYYCLLLRRYTVAYDLITIILLITVLNKYVDSGKAFEVRFEIRLFQSVGVKE